MSKVKETEQGLAVVTGGSTAMAMLDGSDSKDVRGKEGITGEDLRLPFISIAQKTSKVMDPSEGVYLDGVKFLDLYNTETREIYGPGPIAFLPIMHRKRANLLTEDNKLGDLVDWNDARVIPPWVKGSKVASVDELEGIRIYDWVVLLVPSMQFGVVSFKSKSFPAGQSLATFVATRKGPAFNGKYTLSSVKDQNPQGSFGKLMVMPAGKPEAAEAAYAAELYEQFKDKQIVGEEEVSDSVVTAEVVPPVNDNIPF